MQEIIGITPQRHSFIAVTFPERGQNQRRLPKEQTAQDWRDNNLGYSAHPILNILLPNESSCEFWNLIGEYLEEFGNRRSLLRQTTLPMPYFSEEALLPLPPTPEAGFRRGLSLY